MLRAQRDWGGKDRSQCQQIRSALTREMGLAYRNIFLNTISLKLQGFSLQTKGALTLWATLTEFFN